MISAPHWGSSSEVLCSQLQKEASLPRSQVLIPFLRRPPERSNLSPQTAVKVPSERSRRTLLWQTLFLLLRTSAGDSMSARTGYGITAEEKHPSSPLFGWETVRCGSEQALLKTSSTSASASLRKDPRAAGE